jgi:H+/Cl- antiporter ClcA
VSEPPQAGPPAGGAYLRLVALGALIGIPAALVGAGFLGFVHELEDWLWKVLPGEPGQEPAYLVLGLPVAGALIVLLARRLLPGDGGHRPLEGLSAAPAPVSHAPGVALAAIGSLGFGAVLGPEAPVIALGSVAGVATARLARLDERATTVLGTAGSFSAISALFGGPLVAGMLLVEGGLAMGARLLPVLLPGLVSAGIGYLIFIGLGDWSGLDAPGLVVGDLPSYEGTHVLDLLVGMAVGVVTAVLIVWVRAAATRIDGEGTRRLGCPRYCSAAGSPSARSPSSPTCSGRAHRTCSSRARPRSRSR